MKLLHNQMGSPRYDLQHKQISTLPNGLEVHVSRGPGNPPVLVSKQSLTGKLVRWMLLLQEFEFKIQHRSGTQHAIANYLSRIKNGEDATGCDDDFPDS